MMPSHTTEPTTHTVLIFYKYVTITEPKKLMLILRELCTRLSLKGRILIAEEGINGTVEGITENAEAFAKALLVADPALADMRIKTSAGNGRAFPKMMIKVRNEIVGTRFSAEEVDPRVKTGKYLSSDELHEKYENGEVGKDLFILDMRNSYEYISGHFKDSIDPGMSVSRELPDVLAKLENLKNKKILTVCTAGVRCEKMSAYLLSRGFSDVYQLEDGMHGYMQKYPGKDFLGTLYTFDNRVTMDFGGEREIIGRCHLCTQPTERYLNCAYLPCHIHFLICENCASGEADSTGYSVGGKKVYCSEGCREKGGEM